MPPHPTPEATRIAALADACVLCGLCLPHCPTYALDRREPESPRGRIMLFKALAEARLTPEPATLAPLDHCLACRACERVCPAQVQYGRILQQGRALQRPHQAPPWRQRMLEWLLPRPLWRAMALALGTRVRRWVPGPWRRLPSAPPRTRSAPRTLDADIVLFAGCMGQHFEAAALQAAARVLRALGNRVTISEHPGCCGAVHRHAGNLASAQANFESLVGLNWGAAASIVTLASGCHESLAEGMSTLSGAPPVRDLFALLDADPRSAGLRFRAAELGTRVALHLPCTQVNVVRNADRIALWLARIPGLTVETLPGGCCGAAGSHMLTEPRRADAFRAPLIDAMRTQGAATLCSSNVGCRMHLAVGLERAGLVSIVRHPIELLAEHLDD